MKATGLVLVALVLITLALPAPVWAEVFRDSNRYLAEKRNPTTFPQTVKDVAVNGIQASTLSVLRGEIVTIHVTVQNLGSGTESFSLFLGDDNEGQDITSVDLTLNSGQSLTVGLPWDTRNAPGGPHILTAFISLGGDQNATNDSLSLASPVEVKLNAIVLGDSRNLNKPDAYYEASLTKTDIVTQSNPIASLFIGGQDTTFSSRVLLPAVTTSQSPYTSIYVANADATFQPVAALQDPFQQGEIRGIIHLQGLASSTGAYVEAGTARHFVSASGSFSFLVPNGMYDLVIDAPGYVPVRIPNTMVNPGEVLSIPELTLPFGDANGDGRIDILDLSIAAGNFGATTKDMLVP